MDTCRANNKQCVHELWHGIVREFKYTRKVKSGRLAFVRVPFEIGPLNQRSGPFFPDGNALE